MDNPELIPAVIACLVAITGWLKAHSDIKAINSDRDNVKSIRDADSQKLHDDVLKLQFQATESKDNIKLLFDLNKDNTSAINTLNTQLATVLTKIDTIISTLNEIKDRDK